MKRAKMCDRTPARRRSARTSRAAFMIASPGAAVTTTWWNSNAGQATVGARAWQTVSGTRAVPVKREASRLGDEAQDPYEALREHARALAAEKRATGEVPEGTGDALDRLFVEGAPGGAPGAGVAPAPGGPG